MKVSRRGGVIWMDSGQGRDGLRRMADLHHDTHSLFSSQARLSSLSSTVNIFQQ